MLQKWGTISRSTKVFEEVYISPEHAVEPATVHPDSSNDRAKEAQKTGDQHI